MCVWDKYKKKHSLRILLIGSHSNSIVSNHLVLHTRWLVHILFLWDPMSQILNSGGFIIITIPSIPIWNNDNISITNNTHIYQGNYKCISLTLMSMGAHG